MEQHLQNVIREANAQIDLLNTEKAALERDLSYEQTKTRELQDQSYEKEREYAKLVARHEILKKKTMIVSEEQLNDSVTTLFRYDGTNNSIRPPIHTPSRHSNSTNYQRSAQPQSLRMSNRPQMWPTATHAIHMNPPTERPLTADFTAGSYGSRQSHLSHVSDPAGVDTTSGRVRMEGRHGTTRLPLRDARSPVNAQYRATTPVTMGLSNSRLTMIPDDNRC